MTQNILKTLSKTLSKIQRKMHLDHPGYRYILKCILFLYIFTSIKSWTPYTIIQLFMNDNGIKIIMILLIIYTIKVDYTISLLLSMTLILSILIYNKDTIDKIRIKMDNKIKHINELKSEEVPLNTNIKTLDKSIDEINNDDDNITEEYHNSSIAVFGEVDDAVNLGHSLTHDRLYNAQNNIHKSVNDEIYYSGNYTGSVNTVNGRLENKPNIN
jgi:hypothetical protein